MYRNYYIMHYIIADSHTVSRAKSLVSPSPFFGGSLSDLIVDYTTDYYNYYLLYNEHSTFTISSEISNAGMVKLAYIYPRRELADN